MVVKLIALLITAISFANCFVLKEPERYSLTATGWGPGMCSKVKKFNDAATAAEFFSKDLQMVVDIVRGTRFIAVEREFDKAKPCKEDRFKVRLFLNMETPTTLRDVQGLMDSAANYLGRRYTVSLKLAVGAAEPIKLVKPRKGWSDKHQGEMPTGNKTPKVAATPTPWYPPHVENSTFDKEVGGTFRTKSCQSRNWVYVDTAGVIKKHRGFLGGPDKMMFYVRNLTIEDSGSYLCFRKNETYFNHILKVVPKKVLEAEMDLKAKTPNLKVGDRWYAPAFDSRDASGRNFQRRTSESWSRGQGPRLTRVESKAWPQLPPRHPNTIDSAKEPRKKDIDRVHQRPATPVHSSRVLEDGVKEVAKRPDNSTCSSVKNSQKHRNQTTHVHEGEKLFLHCHHKQWNRVLPAGQVISPMAYLSSTLGLTIDKVTMSDTGAYRCYRDDCALYIEYELVVFPIKNRSMYNRGPERL